VKLPKEALGGLGEKPVAAGCRTCSSVSGENPISPAPPIFVGKYWSVEHAWPTSMVGWTVLVLRRHAEALHDLTQDEFAELGELLRSVTPTLRRETGCLKEYVSCYAEAEGFSHIHVHVVPRSADLPFELRGPNVFSLIGPDVETADREEVVRFCSAARELVTVEMGT
jgi:diadenosine tetraphosphate (Ap4A) HIT family hydrolase